MAPDRCKGTSLIRKRPFPWDHQRALCTALLYGSRRRRFRSGQVSLYLNTTTRIHDLPPSGGVSHGELI